MIINPLNNNQTMGLFDIVVEYIKSKGFDVVDKDDNHIQLGRRNNNTAFWFSIERDGDDWVRITFGHRKKLSDKGWDIPFTVGMFFSDFETFKVLLECKYVD